MAAIATSRGTQSIPFAEGKDEFVAVKIVNDRRIESLSIMELS